MQTRFYSNYRFEHDWNELQAVLFCLYEADSARINFNKQQIFNTPV